MIKTINKAIMLWLIMGSFQTLQALIITEVQYHPNDDQLEFIELYNDREVFEDLGGFAFTEGIQYDFPAEMILPVKSYLVIASDPCALERTYDIDGVLGPYNGRLSNSGERVSLSNESGAMVLTMNYQDHAPWPLAPDGTGHSLTRFKMAGDPEHPNTWGPSTTRGGTPGYPDEAQVIPEPPTWETLLDIGTMARYFKGIREPSPDGTGQATTDWTEIGFNDSPTQTDWLEGPSGYGYSNDDTELQSINTVLEDMRNNYISVYVRWTLDLTEEMIDSIAQLRVNVTYDDGYVLYLNGECVGSSSQLTQIPPTFDQEAGTASDYTPEQIDLTPYLSLLETGDNVLAIQVHNASIGGSSDCIAAITVQALEVAQSQAQADNPLGALLINEIDVYDPNLPQEQWVELYNSSGEVIDLNDLYLSPDTDNLLQFALPDQVELSPGDCYPVMLDFDLDPDGDTLYLTFAGPDGVMRVLDAVTCEATMPSSSLGRCPDGAPRIVALKEPTLGERNAPAWRGDLVINEIMYHHISTEDRYEYVELYNRGGETIDLAGWKLGGGIDYTFAEGSLAPGSYAVVAKDPNWLVELYSNLEVGINLWGPFSGRLSNHSDRLRLTQPVAWVDPGGTDAASHDVVVDDVTYYDGGHWPKWADGYGSSLELCNPDSANDSYHAWQASKEAGKSTWQPFSFTVSASDQEYTHDDINIVDLMLLGQGQALLDDLQCMVDGQNVLEAGDFENDNQVWRFLGNHADSQITRQASHGGQRALQLVASGRGDPGGNRINQSISTVQARSVTLSGWAKWQRGCPYLLMRCVRERSPVQPRRPARTFTLDVPTQLGTPGALNSTWIEHCGPAIRDVTHSPVIPAVGDPIVVTARIEDEDELQLAILSYMNEETGLGDAITMVDDGSGNDLIAGDQIYTATIPAMDAVALVKYYLLVMDGSSLYYFPSDTSERCLVRVGDTAGNTALATYRVWITNEVIQAFRQRTNLSNQLMDCTFVYNDTEVFYNAKIRLRGSPWLRPGSGWSPVDRHAYRIEFPPHQSFRGREEINLDNTEGTSRGPLQERASYWFYRKMGLPYSRQEYVRLILNGNSYGSYEDVQKVDGTYIDRWFSQDNEGYLYEIDDYFEFDAIGTYQTNLEEGIDYDNQHPLLKETYRWCVEKRSHRENDNWDHLFELATRLNTPSSRSDYEIQIESAIHPDQFLAVMSLRHMVGDWDTYGYRRGKNSMIYFAPNEGKWYLLPWDIDFTLGSGDGPTSTMPPINGNIFPEVAQLLHYDKYNALYWQFVSELIQGPWQTSYGTNAEPTAFDRFLDDSAAVLEADGQGAGRRDEIKEFVRQRRNYVRSRLGQ